MGRTDDCDEPVDVDGSGLRDAHGTAHHDGPNAHSNPRHANQLLPGGLHSQSPFSHAY